MSVSFEFTLVSDAGLTDLDRETVPSPVPITTLVGSGSMFAKPSHLDFTAGTGSVLIQNKVQQVLSTVSYGPAGQGELPWRPEFGASISALRFSKLKDTLPNVVANYVRESLERWVPEVELKNVGVKADNAVGLLLIRVLYTEVDSRKTVNATASYQG